MRVPGFRFVQAAGNYADRDGMHYGIAIHATSNTASDDAESSYAAHRNDGTSAHAYVDWDSLTQALDTERKAGHAGSAYGNEHAIAIEFTGLDSYSRQKWLDSIAWDQVGAWIAYILKNDPDYAGFQVRRASVAEMQTNPKVKAFYGHDDMRRAWGGTDHTDPGPGFPWDRLFSAVNAHLNPSAALEADDMDADQDQRLKNVEQWLVHFFAGEVTGSWPHSGPGGAVPKLVPNEKLNQLTAGGVNPAQVATLVVEQLGPLLPTLADIEAIVDAKVKAALNSTKLSVTSTG